MKNLAPKFFAVLAVGREHAFVTDQIDPRFQHQRRQPGNESQRLNNDRGCAVTIACVTIG